jgi:hypothetical protein
MRKLMRPTHIPLMPSVFLHGSRGIWGVARKSERGVRKLAKDADKNMSN